MAEMEWVCRNDQAQEALRTRVHLPVQAYINGDMPVFFNIFSFYGKNSERILIMAKFFELIYSFSLCLWHTIDFMSRKPQTKDAQIPDFF